MNNNEDFIVEFNVCGHRYSNWSGSTPCCGSLAFIVEEGGEIGNVPSVFAKIDGGQIEPIELTFKNKN